MATTFRTALTRAIDEVKTILVRNGRPSDSSKDPIRLVFAFPSGKFTEGIA